MPVNKLLRVCMCLSEEDGISAIVTTSERFWKEHHLMDDGGGPDYARIEEAMEAAGAERLGSSYYELPDTGLDRLVQDLRAQGIELVTDPAFSTFLDGPNQ